jgi:hypothetical protein
MKVTLIAIIIAFSATISAQTTNNSIKIIPQMSMKIGSQNPAIGGQFDLAAGMLFYEKYFAGLGAGYCTNMGMGGHTFPIYTDARIYFSTKAFLFPAKDEENNFQAGFQIGMDINNNQPFKTGFIAACEFTYRFDFIKIKQFNFPPFYGGFKLEYNYTKFVDEYRGILIQDGYLKHILFNLKIAFDIPSIKLKTKE